MKIFDQERRCDHSDPIVEPPQLLELAHPGIDNRITRLTCFPCFKADLRDTLGRIVFDNCVKSSVKVAPGRFGGKEDHLGKKIPPDQLANQVIATEVGPGDVCYLAWVQNSKAKRR